MKYIQSVNEALECFMLGTIYEKRLIAVLSKICEMIVKCFAVGSLVLLQKKLHGGCGTNVCKMFIRESNQIVLPHLVSSL